MHKQNFVMAVKVGGKVLREFDNSVYIPFGSEYSILLKNLSSRKAKVSVFIDGTDALDGTKLIIDPRSDVDLKRFIENGNFDKGNSFKFIEKTAKIEKYRGNKAEDGLITIHYEFEKEYFPPPTPTYPYIWNDYTKNFIDDNGPFGAPKIYYSSNTEPLNAASTSSSVLRSRSMNSSPRTLLSTSTAGITAPGSISDQKFTSTYGFIGDGVTHTMTMELKGAVNEQVLVKKEVTVRKVKRCTMCGTNVKQVAKFCHECGSSVEIV